MSTDQIKLLSFLKLKTLVLTLLLMGLSTISLSRSTFANVTPQTGDGTNNSVPGGTRSAGEGCFNEGQKPITPLIPKTNKKLGLTLASHPTILIYVQKNTAIAGEFILKDSSEQKVYEDIVSLPNSQGIIEIKIPTEESELKVNETYSWTFTLICEASIPGIEAVVEGSIQRVNPTENLRIKLLQAPESDHWLIYSEAGIWYETVVTLAEEIRSNPNSVKLNSEWKNLLNSVGLSEVVKDPSR